MKEVSTLFVLKDEEEHCILFDQDSPSVLYDVLFEHADRSDVDITKKEVCEVIEGLVPVRLREI